MINVSYPRQRPIAAFTIVIQLSLICIPALSKSAVACSWGITNQETILIWHEDQIITNDLGSIILWNLTDNTTKKIINLEMVTKVSAGGAYIAASGGDNTVSCKPINVYFDVISPAENRSIVRVKGLTFSTSIIQLNPNGTLLAATTDNRLTIYRVPSMEIEKEWRFKGLFKSFHDNTDHPPLHASWSPDSKYLAIAYWNKLEIFNTDNWKSILTGNGKELSNIRWDSSSVHVATLSKGTNAINIYNVDDRKPISEITNKEWIRTYDFSPEDRLVIGTKNNLSTIDINSGQTLNTWHFPNATLYTMKYSLDGQYLALFRKLNDTKELVIYTVDNKTIFSKRTTLNNFHYLDPMMAQNPKKIIEYVNWDRRMAFILLPLMPALLVQGGVEWIGRKPKNRSEDALQSDSSSKRSYKRFLVGPAIFLSVFMLLGFIDLMIESFIT